MKGKMNLFSLQEAGIIDLIAEQASSGEELNKEPIKIKIGDKKYGLTFNEDLLKLKILNDFYELKKSVYYIKLFGVVFNLLIIILLGLCVFLMF